MKKFTLILAAVLASACAVTASAEIVGNDVTAFGVPSVGSGNPGGSGANVSVIVDGYRPVDGVDGGAQSRDTFGGACDPFEESFILEFEGDLDFTAVEFTEGMHFGDGGWFTSAPAVEVLVNGTWKEAAAEVSPAYPDEKSHGASYETYTYTLAEPVVCDGVRIVGKPGGSAYFVSVGEITPVVTEVFETATDGTSVPSIICSVSSPTGGGSQDITVICDGVVPKASSANDKMQYDTYTGGSAGVPAYVGYFYAEEREVTSVEFTEGNHFNNGGWFRNGDVHVEVYVNGQWIRPECTVSPAYPDGDTQSAFGSGYNTYTFTLNEAIVCSGVRLYGTAGGSSGFISIGELAVK